MRRLFLLAAVAGTLLSGCTFALHHNHTGDYDVQNGLETLQVVEASDEAFVLMGMTGNTDYVDRAFSELKSQCTGGQLTGIQTRYSTHHGFFSWTHKVAMKAYCART